MSSALGPAYYEYHEQHAFLGHRIATESGASDATIAAIEHEARVVLRRALAAATAGIEAQRAALDRIRAALVEHETLDHDALAVAIGPSAQPITGGLATSRVAAT